VTAAGPQALGCLERAPTGLIRPVRAPIIESIPPIGPDSPPVAGLTPDCRVARRKPERNPPLATPEQIADETRRLRRARLIVDLASGLIMQGRLRRSEAEALVAVARRKVLDLFPGGRETFEIVYGPRFRRLVDEFARPGPGTTATVIPFPGDRRP
jgi:hypothetical protein